MSKRAGYRRPTKVDTSAGPIESLLSLFWDSGITPLSPNHPSQKLGRMMDAGDRGDAKFTPEAEANRKKQARAYQRGLLDNPEYQQAMMELGEGVMDFSGGLMGTVKKIPSRMASTYQQLPAFDWQANVGKKMKPTEADLTDAGSDYVGQMSSQVQPESLLGGPMYGSLKSSRKDNLMWAGDAEGIGKRYVESEADLMPVISMSQDAHKSNRSVTNAVFKTLNAFVRDGRIQGADLTKLDELLRTGGGKSRLYTDDVLNKAKKKLAAGEKIKDVAAELGVKHADLSMRLKLKDMPKITSSKFKNFTKNASFDTRAKLVSILDSPAAEKLGGPNVRKIIRETLDPNFAGVDRGSGLLISEIDKTAGVVPLGKSTNTTLHPSYDYAIKGGNEARLTGPLSVETLFPDFFNQPHIQKMSRDDQMYTFKRTLPVQEITQQLANKLSAIKPLQKIQSQRQANLTMDFAEGNWRSTDLPVNQDGVSPADFSRALRNSDASPTLTLYTESQIKEGVKKGDFKAYQLGDKKTNSQIFFGLKKNYSYKDEYGFEHPELTGNETALVGVVNNETGAKGVGGPSVLLKAIQEGATVLDAYAVPSKKFPSGFLPQLYNDFGFVELGRIKFDPQYYTKQEVADLKAYWRSTGWDESMGLPEVAIMKWKGDDAIRPDATRYFIEQGGIGTGPKAAGVSAAAAQSYGQRAGKSSGTAQRSGILSDAGGNTGSIRAGNRTPVPQRVRGVLSETVNLSPTDALAYGLDPQRIQRVGAKFPSLLTP